MMIQLAPRSAQETGRSGLITLAGEENDSRALCRIAMEFKVRGNISMIALLMESGYLKNHSQIAEAHLTEYFRDHQELIEAWLIE